MKWFPFVIQSKKDLKEIEAMKEDFYLQLKRLDLFGQIRKIPKGQIFNIVWYSKYGDEPEVSDYYQVTKSLHLKGMFIEYLLNERNRPPHEWFNENLDINFLDYLVQNKYIKIYELKETETHQNIKNLIFTWWYE